MYCRYFHGYREPGVFIEPQYFSSPKPGRVCSATDPLKPALTLAQLAGSRNL